MPRSLFSAADLAAIAGGGVVGATVRRLVTGWLAPEPSTLDTWFAYASSASASATPFDWSTIAVNLTGCLLLGVAVALMTGAVGVRRRALLAASTGFCGSLTTFSTFAVDVATKLQPSAPTGSWREGLSYIFLSVLGGAALFAIGRMGTRRWVVSQ